MAVDQTGSSVDDLGQIADDHFSVVAFREHRWHWFDHMIRRVIVRFKYNLILLIIMFLR